jgi:hypothetical protein
MSRTLKVNYQWCVRSEDESQRDMLRAVCPGDMPEEGSGMWQARHKINAIKGKTNGTL